MPAAKMNGNIGKQQEEAKTTLPSAAKLATIVRPDRAFALAGSMAIALFYRLGERCLPIPTTEQQAPYQSFASSIT